MTEFRAFGKFLISGEYLILHGARGLALPLVKKFQTLNVSASNADHLKWQAFDENKNIWFEAAYKLQDLELLSTTDQERSHKIQGLLYYLQERKPELFRVGLTFTTQMNFSATWGLGSSSTLISLLSQWSGVDAFELQQKFFGGSGYDVACATARTPLIYELQGTRPKVQPVAWDPPFKDRLSFIYLGQKQNSRLAVAQFKGTTPKPTDASVREVSALTNKFLVSLDLESFQEAIRQHEEVISKLVGQRPIKEQLFSDFPGEIKSLGGWGGDFVMVASQSSPESYFRSRGHELIFSWKDLVTLD